MLAFTATTIVGWGKKSMVLESLEYFKAVYSKNLSLREFLHLVSARV